MKIITVGRSSNNDVSVNDIKVSRNHLQIVQGDDGGCYVVDLNSTNGTFVNGARISGKTCLRPNDEVRIGDTVLPWQTYINKSPVPKPPIRVEPVPPAEPPRNPGHSRMFLYVTIACVVLLLAGGGVVWKVRSDKKAEQMASVERAKEREREVDDILKSNKIADSEEKAKKAEKAKKKAIEDARAAEIAKNRAESEKNEAINKRREAENKKNDAIEKQKKAENEKKKAEEKAKNAQTLAQNAAKKQSDAEKAKSVAEEAKRNMERKLEESLDKLFKMHASALKAKDWVEIAKKLKFSDDEMSEMKSKVEQKFNKEDIAGKQRIIDVMEAVKNKPLNENDKHLKQQQADSTITMKKEGV